jgi:hypothetical protein
LSRYAVPGIAIQFKFSGPFDPDQFGFGESGPE